MSIFDIFSDAPTSSLANLDVMADVPNLDGLIRNYLESPEEFEEDGERMKGFHPSQISGRTCPLFFYYHITEPSPKQEHPPELMEIFHEGTQIHERIQNYLSEYLYGTWLCRTCRVQINANSNYVKTLKDDDNSKRIYSHSLKPAPLPKKCPNCSGKTFKYLEWRVINKGVTGKIDGILKKTSGEFIGLEIKSAGVTSFLNIGPKSKLLAKYKEQFGIYLKLLGLNEGLILMHCKGGAEAISIYNKLNNSNFPENIRKQFLVTTSQLDLKKLFERMELALSWKAKKVNALPEPIKTPECEKCSFKKKCWSKK